MPSGDDLMICVRCARGLRLCGLHIDELTAVLTFGKYYDTVNQSKQRVILAHTHVFTGMMHCTALTFDDVACFGELAAKNLNTESFRFRLTAVLRRAYTFLMCHVVLSGFLVKQ